MSRSVPVMRTWTAGEVDTDTFMSANVHDLGTFLLGPPAFALRQASAAQTLTTATWTSILLDTEDLDSDNGHSTVTNTSRYTCQVAGWYWVVGNVAFAGNTAGQRSIRFYVNGSPVNASQDDTLPVPAAGNTTSISTSRLVYLNAGDYLEVVGYQNSGGNLNTTIGAPNGSCLSGFWVSQ